VRQSLSGLMVGQKGKTLGPEKKKEKRRGGTNEGIIEGSGGGGRRLIPEVLKKRPLSGEVGGLLHLKKAHASLVKIATWSLTKKGKKEGGRVVKEKKIIAFLGTSRSPGRPTVEKKNKSVTREEGRNHPGTEKNLSKGNLVIDCR